MTDLVKRAREALEGVASGPWVLRRPAFAVAARTLVPAMADRIEALEAERNDYASQIAELLPAVNREAVEQRARADALEAEAAQLREALRFYVAGCEWQDPPPNCDRPAAQCCKTAVAALKET